MKRFRKPKVKPGQLIAYYGRIDGEAPDVCYAWGAGLNKRHGNLLHYIFGAKRMTIAHNGPGFDFEPSAIEQLEAAGYDLSTLKFSIEAKQDASKTTEAAKEKTS